MTISAKTRISISRESSWGNPGDWKLFPVNPPTLTQTYENILDQGLRGVPSKDFGVFRGAGASDATLEGVAYPEEIGYLILGIMGTVDSSGSVHEFTLFQDPPSFSIEDYPKVEEPGSGSIEAIAYQYRGCYVASLGLTFNAGEGAVGFSATLRGKNSGTQTPEGTPSGTPAAPFLGWEGSVDVCDLDGTLEPFGRLVSAEWTFAREVVLQHALNMTQEPSFGYTGPLEVTCRAIVEFHSDNDIKRYREDTHMHFVVTVTKDDKFLEIDCPDVFFESYPEIDRGAVNTKVNWELRALYDPSTETPATITLKNDQADYLT